MNPTDPTVAYFLGPVVAAVISGGAAIYAGLVSKKVKKEFKTNGGASAKDDLLSIRSTVNRIEQRIDDHLEFHAEHR